MNACRVKLIRSAARQVTVLCGGVGVEVVLTSDLVFAFRVPTMRW
jgi:hypothetical protein